jgi:hypothetical protein
MQLEAALSHLWGIALGRIGIDKLVLAVLAEVILLPSSVTVFADVHRLTTETLHPSIVQSLNIILRLS